ncbi:MAG TPA: hypothetical protein VG408_07265, partial [Actinomycetota bacterium]|nr:hypothetical protein [Actinomycetota bacterium]
APEQIAAIRTGRHGAHNITVVPELDATDGTPEQRVLVYAASPHNSQKRDPLTGAADPGDYNEVIAVPLDAPSTSEVVARIKVGDSGGCHDISFFLPRGIAACNRGAAGTALWDVRDDPEEPRDDGASLLDPKVIAYMLVEAPPTIVEAPRTGPTTMHSSAFSWDGDTLVVSDENFFEATLSGTCRSQAPPYAGSIFFYDVSPDALRWLWTAPARGTRADLPEWGVAKRVPPTGYHLPPPVENNGNCSSKQVSVIPLASGRDVAVISWMGGGTSVIDFTRPDAPMQLAYFAPLPGTNDRTAAWASYWYNGSIFVNNAYGCWLQICTGTLTRGLDVLRLDGHDLGDTIPMPSFNFGLQECLTVPSGAAHQGLGDCP